MADTLRIKRRVSGGAGAPSALMNAEPAYNFVDDTLYLGKGDDGSGNATSIIPIGGDGRTNTLIANALSAAIGTSLQAYSASLTQIAGLSDPNVDRILFWDDSVSTWAYLSIGSGLSLTGTTLEATGSGGSVTSVGLAVPTGFSVSGSPVTTSGTLTFTYTAGYQGYTATEASKLSGIATGATVGATWGTNLSSIPAIVGSFAALANAAGWLKNNGSGTLSWAAPTKSDVGLGNVDNTADANKPISSATQAALDGKQALDAELTALAALTSAANKIPMFSGSGTATLLDFSTSTSLGTSNTTIPSQNAVKVYVDGLIDAANALQFKGTIDCSASPNYPAADSGWMYMVSVAGKIGGASGPNVENGDMLVCLVDSSASGTHATVGANWNIIQKNLDGALTTSSIGVTVQAYDAGLQSIAGLTTAANKGIYTTGADVYVTYDLSAGGRALANAAGTANTIPYFSAANTVSLQTTTVGGLALLNNAGTANTMPYYSAANTVSLASLTAAGRALLDDASNSDQRTTLGLGTMATQNANAVAITGGTIDGVVLDGGVF